jgi:hypothetical protein
VHGAAFSVGGAIAILELSQPSLWAWLGETAQRAGAGLNAAVSAPAPTWLAPTPMFCAAVLGGALLIAYLTSLLRET